MSDAGSVTESYVITESDDTVCEHDPDYIKRLVLQHERKLQRQREYYQRVKNTDEYKEKRRQQAKQYRERKKATANTTAPTAA